MNKLAFLHLLLCPENIPFLGAMFLYSALSLLLLNNLFYAPFANSSNLSSDKRKQLQFVCSITPYLFK